MIRDQQVGNPVEWLLMLLAKYRDGDLNHKDRCVFKHYAGLGVMDDRCEVCKLTDFELDRPNALSVTKHAPPEGSKA